MMRKLNQQVFDAQRATKHPSNNVSTVHTSGRHSARGDPPILNYGERLYQKGIKRKEDLERHIREAKTMKDEREKQRFTFQPQINQASKHIMRSETQLLKYGEQVREKIEQKRTEILLQEQIACKFRPNINQNSTKMLSARGYERQNKFSTLYEDAKLRKERQDKIYSACVESECTFQPDTQATRYHN